MKLKQSKEIDIINVDRRENLYYIMLQKAFPSPTSTSTFKPHKNGSLAHSSMHILFLMRSHPNTNTQIQKNEVFPFKTPGDANALNNTYVFCLSFSLYAPALSFHLTTSSLVEM